MATGGAVGRKFPLEPLGATSRGGPAQGFFPFFLARGRPRGFFGFQPLPFFPGGFPGPNSFPEPKDQKPLFRGPGRGAFRGGLGPGVVPPLLKAFPWVLGKFWENRGVFRGGFPSNFFPWWGFIPRFPEFKRVFPGGIPTYFGSPNLGPLKGFPLLGLVGNREFGGPLVFLGRLFI